MIDKRDKYFEKIHLSGKYVQRFNQFIEVISKFYPDDILDIFISQKTNGLDFNYLVLISGNHLIYVINIFEKPEFHIVPLLKAITYLKISPEMFDFEYASDISILKVSISIAGGELYLEPLVARGTNCEKLLEITKKYLLPNVVDMVDVENKQSGSD